MRYTCKLDRGQRAEAAQDNFKPQYNLTQCQNARRDMSVVAACADTCQVALLALIYKLNRMIVRMTLT